MGLFSPSLTVNQCINRSRTEKGAVLLDVRERDAFKEKYISGSVNVPLSEINTLMPIRYKDKQTRFYVIGSVSCQPSDAVKKLKKLGYKNVVRGSCMEDHHGLMKHG